MQQLQTFSCQINDLGLVDYLPALSLQREALEDVINGGCQRIFFCEHQPVFTLGRLASESNFLLNKEDIEKQGIKIIHVDRGGEVTLHSPGQLVVYPILDLNHYGRDLKAFLYKLEQVAIDLLRDFDIVADRIPGQRGVWVGPQKIASIGIGVRKWVSYHGMAINVNTDLRYFSMIKPCGLNVKMTSIRQINGQAADLNDVKRNLARHFCEGFHLNEIRFIQNESRLDI